MGRFNLENMSGYTQVELDELSYRFRRAVEAEVESWDHESERYLDWKAGLADENDAEHQGWIAGLEAVVVRSYEEEQLNFFTAIGELKLEAARAGDRSMVLYCIDALNGDDEALDVCREAIFDARHRSEED